MDNLSAALGHAARGWLVFPCHTIKDGKCDCGNKSCSSPGKHPRTKNGVKDASKEEKRIRQWWERYWPHANVAIATGAGSGLVVIDVDPRHGGHESMENLAMPETVHALTGGGGDHYYFRHPGGVKIGNQAGKLGPGIDVRGDGGYVLAPPSNHLSGKQYEWEASSGPEQVALADIPAWLVTPDGAGHSRIPVTPAGGGDGKILNLTFKTKDYLDNGAIEGERNQRLFAAACDLLGNGWARATVDARLRPIALNSGLTAEEVDQTLNSAAAGERVAGKPTDIEVIAGPTPSCGESSPPDAPNTPQPKAKAVKHRVVLSNVADWTPPPGKSGRKRKPKRTFKTSPRIAAELYEATDKWPRAAGGMLFCAYPANGLPGVGNVQWISATDQFFAWASDSMDLRWTNKECKAPGDDALRTPATKGEFFRYVVDHPGGKYSGVEFLPHFPQVDGVYYIPCTLPAIKPGDGLFCENSKLREIFERFNAETEQDRMLMLAAMITPGWGGPTGTRPYFLFTGSHGVGVGKTQTAEFMASIWGGSIGVGGDEEFEQVKKRLLSPESLSRRVILLDNYRQKMKSGDMEGMISADTIDGWRPYHGQASRPNYMTWFITSNSPHGTRDIADRAIVVKLGKAQHNSDFVGWRHGFVRAHRAEIIAEIMAILAGPDRSNLVEFDRWRSWQLGVLAKLPGMEGIMATIRERRKEIDSDDEDAESMAMAITAEIAKLIPDYEDHRVYVERQRLWRWLIQAGVIEKDFGMRGLMTKIRELSKSGPLSIFEETKRNDSRGWTRNGTNTHKGQRPTDMPTDASDHYGWKG